MKRSTIVALGTLAGVAGVLGLNPEGPDLTATGVGTTATETVSTKAGSTDTTAAAPQAASTVVASSSDKVTIKGKAYPAARYGNVQLQADITGGKITSITAISVPQNDGKSMQISSYSIPILTKRALAAQSANINGLSGATFTSNAYAQSLQSILDQMG